MGKVKGVYGFFYISGKYFRGFIRNWLFLGRVSGSLGTGGRKILFFILGFFILFVF